MLGLLVTKTAKCFCSAPVNKKDVFFIEMFPNHQTREHLWRPCTYFKQFVQVWEVCLIYFACWSLLMTPIFVFFCLFPPLFLVSGLVWADLGSALLSNKLLYPLFYLNITMQNWKCFFFKSGLVYSYLTQTSYLPAFSRFGASEKAGWEISVFRLGCKALVNSLTSQINPHFIQSKAS